MTDISNYCPACECAMPDECGCTHTCGRCGDTGMVNHGSDYETPCDCDNDAARDAAGEQPSDPRYETYAEKNLISPTPRWDIAGHPDVAIHMAIADLTVQVARIANALEYHSGINPKEFPCTDNEMLGLHGRDGRS